MKLRGAITIIDTGYDYQREIDLLNKMGIATEYIPLDGTNETERIIRTIKGRQFVLAGPELWDSAAMEGVGTLKMIARLGAGTEKIDLEAAGRLGIAVSNTPGANACSVAQHSLAFMLDLGLSISRYDRNLRHNSVERGRAKDLIGKIIGLVGFGNISRMLAGLLGGFETELLVYDPYPDPRAAASLKARYVSLEELISRSDFISLHLPLTEGTRGMVDRDFLKKMKPTAYLINTSRGGIVSEGDLIQALNQGIIAGAALDVYETSPLMCDSPLLSMENVVLTPYVAYSSELGNRKTMDMALKSISEYLRGLEVSHLLNPEYVKK